VNEEAAASAPGAVGKPKKKASPCVSTSTPPFTAHASRITALCSASAVAYASKPISRSIDVDPSTSVKRKVTVPVGSSGRTPESRVDPGRGQELRHNPHPVPGRSTGPAYAADL
jgi:hypothetical protein